MGDRIEGEGRGGRLVPDILRAECFTSEEVQYFI